MIRAFGEAALLVEAGTPQRAQVLAAYLHTEPIEGVTGIVPGLDSVLIETDPLRPGSAFISEAVAARLASLRSDAPAGRQCTIPVVYDGRDLAAVADLCGLSEADVIERHVAAELRVLFDGFAPGFAYLGDLPDELRVPRLDTPRTRTPAGSVGIAGALSGIYPAELPGGWRIIGRTPFTLFDPRRDPPAYLVPGDTVRFEQIAAGDWGARAGVPEDWP